MKFVKETVFKATREEVFAFHERPDAFELLLPPWEVSEVVQPPSGLAVGTQVIVKTRIAPLIWIAFVAEHVAYEKNVMFEDVMRKGPFKSWRHQHLFFDHPDGCRLRDEIDYEAPLSFLGRLAAPIAIVPRIRKMFDYRHEVTLREVMAHKKG